MMLPDFTKKRIIGLVSALVARFYAPKRAVNFTPQLQVMSYLNTAAQSIYGEIIPVLKKTAILLPIVKVRSKSMAFFTRNRLPYTETIHAQCQTVRPHSRESMAYSDI